MNVYDVCVCKVVLYSWYTDEHSPITRVPGTMAIFSTIDSSFREPYAPYIENVSKMTVEWLHNRWYIKKEASLSFYHACCSTFQLFFSKKNMFFYHTQYNHDFFFGNSSAKSTFKILAKNNSPADYCARFATWNPNHTYIGSKDAGAAPATFKPIFKAIRLHVAKRAQ